MAEEFRLEADELGRVAGGLRDVESRLSAAVARLRGAADCPWRRDYIADLFEVLEHLK